MPRPIRKPKDPAARGRWIVPPLFSIFLLTLLALPTLAAEGVSLQKLNSGGKDVLRLTLAPEVGTSWQDVHVGRVVVRSPQGQRQLESSVLRKSAHLDLVQEEPGCVMVQVDVGPPEAKGFADSWRRINRCSKLFVCQPTDEPKADIASRYGSSAMMTSKSGSRIEIRPLLSPMLLRPGNSFPVRLYFDGGAAQDAIVQAIGPDEQVVQARSDSVGIATLEIPSAGEWTVRFQQNAASVVPAKARKPGKDPGQEFIAELIFDVQPLDFWTAEEGGAP